jgi:hypothetical protein
MKDFGSSLGTPIASNNLHPNQLSFSIRLLKALFLLSCCLKLRGPSLWRGLLLWPKFEFKIGNSMRPSSTNLCHTRSGKPAAADVSFNAGCRPHHTHTETIIAAGPWRRKSRQACSGCAFFLNAAHNYPPPFQSASEVHYSSFGVFLCLIGAFSVSRVCELPPPPPPPPHLSPTCHIALDNGFLSLLQHFLLRRQRSAFLILPSADNRHGNSFPMTPLLSPSL